MPDYPNYKVNGRVISDILEYSENRDNISPFDGFNNNLKNMSFAKFNSYYHPYNPDTKINSYYSNKNISTNNGCVPKGFAPILNNHNIVSGAGKYIFEVTGSGSYYTNSRVRILKDGSTVKDFYSPNVLIIGIQGAGGGGQNGSTGIAGGKGGKGGGNGGYIPVIIELPYSITSATKFITITLGSGGSSENNGGNSVLSLGDNSQTLITLVGGMRGNDSSFYNYKTNTINNSTLENGGIIGNQGEGRIKICPQMLYKSFYYSYEDMNNLVRGYGISAFSGCGNYYGNYILIQNICASYVNSGKLTSGSSYGLNTKYGYSDGDYSDQGNAGPGAGSMMNKGGNSGG